MPDDQSCFDAGVPDRRSATGTPRWVLLVGIVVVVLILLIVTMMLIGGGAHGPRRHSLSDESASQTRVTSVLANYASPEGGDG